MIQFLSQVHIESFRTGEVRRRTYFILYALCPFKSSIFSIDFIALRIFMRCAIRRDTREAAQSDQRKMSILRPTTPLLVHSHNMKLKCYSRVRSLSVPLASESFF